MGEQCTNSANYQRGTLTQIFLVRVCSAGEDDETEGQDRECNSVQGQEEEIELSARKRPLGRESDRLPLRFPPVAYTRPPNTREPQISHSGRFYEKREPDAEPNSLWLLRWCRRRDLNLTDFPTPPQGEETWKAKWSTPQ